MQGSGLFAQAVDNTGRDVTLIIIGLLVVAALLAALTVWYWRYTDPRKRVRPQSVDELLEVDQDQDQAEARAGRGTRVAGTASAPVRAASAAGTAAAAPAASAVPESMSDEQLLEADDGADEWLRLTGPQGRAIR